MNQVTRIEAPTPFNALAAYERERTYSRNIEQLLAKACDLLASECDRREGRGEDVSHIRAFVTRARSVEL